MKKDDLNQEDELRSDYDLRSLTVRGLGVDRKNFGGVTVRLEPDIALMFPNADAVNEALRFLIRVTQNSHFSVSETQPSDPVEAD